MSMNRKDLTALRSTYLVLLMSLMLSNQMLICLSKNRPEKEDVDVLKHLERLRQVRQVRPKICTREIKMAREIDLETLQRLERLREAPF